MRRVMTIATAMALLAGLNVAGAQSRWSVEASGGAAFATSELGGTDLGTGFGFEVNGRYRFMPHLALYAGWDYHHFPTDGPVSGGDMDVEDTGYAFGMRFEHPMASSVAGWIRVGGIANHIELENAAGTIVADSKHGLGWEAGAGLAIPIGERLSLTPGARYRSLSRDLDMGSSTAPVNLRYVSVGMGFAYLF